jgi:hypothetical protein
MPNPAKPGIHLLKAGGAVSVVCIALLAALSYGWNYDIGNSEWVLSLAPIILVSVPALFLTTFAWTYLIGTPAVSVLYAWQVTRRNWRAVMGVLLMAASAVERSIDDRQPQLPRDRDHCCLANGGALERAQAMAAHESPRMTRLYDRTHERLTQDE